MRQHRAPGPGLMQRPWCAENERTHPTVRSLSWVLWQTPQAALPKTLTAGGSRVMMAVVRAVMTATWANLPPKSSPRPCFAAGSAQHLYLSTILKRCQYLLIDRSTCKQAAVAPSRIFPAEIPQRRNALCRLLARTAESSSTAGHNRQVGVRLTARLLLSGPQKGEQAHR